MVRHQSPQLELARASVVSGGRIALRLCYVLMVFLVAFDAVADEESETSRQQHSPRHRIDFGVQWFDAAEGEVVTGSLNYSWIPLAHHSFAATVLLVGSGLSDTEGTK